MNTTRYAANFQQRVVPALGGARRDVRVASPPGVRQVTIGGEQTGTAKRASVRDVCALLEYAGPLTVRDIAGGLNTPEREAVQVVEWMASNEYVKPDEWGRLRLWGDCSGN